MHRKTSMGPGQAWKVPRWAWSIFSSYFSKGTQALFHAGKSLSYIYPSPGLLLRQSLAKLSKKALKSQLPKCWEEEPTLGFVKHKGLLRFCPRVLQACAICIPWNITQHGERISFIHSNHG